MIVPSATPFYYPGGSPGCLLIHGFTGSPKEMQPLGEYLAKKGFAVLGVRLFAHATCPDDMNRARWEDWAASVEDGWHYLQGAVEDMVLIGLSMGGVLALYHAARLPVLGVAALSTPYQLMADPRMHIMKYIWRLFPFISKGESDWQDPRQTEEHFSYDMYPTRSVYELRDLLGEMRAVLPTIDMPVLLMHSKMDKSVSPDNMALIYEDLQVPEDKKSMIWLEKSGHVLTRDIEKARVFEHILSFIQHDLPSQTEP